MDVLSLTEDPKDPAKLRAKLEKQVRIGEGTWIEDMFGGLPLSMSVLRGGGKPEIANTS